MSGFAILSHVVPAGFSFGFVVISVLLSLPIALFLLVIVIEPKRQAKGNEPLGYYGCLLHVVVLSVLLSPLGFGLYLLAQQGLGLFQ